MTLYGLGCRLSRLGDGFGPLKPMKTPHSRNTLGKLQLQDNSLLRGVPHIERYRIQHKNLRESIFGTRRGT